MVTDRQDVKTVAEMGKAIAFLSQWLGASWEISSLGGFIRGGLMGVALLWILPSAVGSAQSKLVTQATAQRWAAAGFRPGEYHGIVMGKSKKRDVVARFGKPEWEGRGEAGTLCLSYRDIGGWKGIANFDLNPRTLVVVGLDIAPKDLTMQQAKQTFGAGAVETRWSGAACFELGGGIGGPLYLDPEGSTSFIEYRHLGVSIEGGNRVNGISYSSKPIGLDRDPCGKAKVQKRGSRPAPRE